MLHFALGGRQAKPAYGNHKKRVTHSNLRKGSPNSRKSECSGRSRVSVGWGWGKHRSIKGTGRPRPTIGRRIKAVGNGAMLGDSPGTHHTDTADFNNIITGRKVEKKRKKTRSTPLRK